MTIQSARQKCRGLNSYSQVIIVGNPYSSHSFCSVGSRQHAWHWCRAGCIIISENLQGLVTRYVYSVIFVSQQVQESLGKFCLHCVLPAATYRHRKWSGLLIYFNFISRKEGSEFHSKSFEECAGKQGMFILPARQPLVEGNADPTKEVVTNAVIFICDVKGERVRTGRDLFQCLWAQRFIGHHHCASQLSINASLSRQKQVFSFSFRFNAEPVFVCTPICDWTRLLRTVHDTAHSQF